VQKEENTHHMVFCVAANRNTHAASETKKQFIELMPKNRKKQKVPNVSGRDCDHARIAMS
jgi:hypothetical protein